MRGKKARQIRQLLSLGKTELSPTIPLTLGNKRVLVIDGISGEHRIEDRSRVQFFCDETKRLYRTLKDAYTRKTDVGLEVQSDIAKIRRF